MKHVKILLPENRILQTPKGAENTKQKSRQCFTVGNMSSLVGHNAN